MEVQHRAGKAQGWMGLWAGVLDLLFPPRCQVCGTLKEPPLCEDCRARIVWFSLPRCLRCGRPFDPLAHGGSFCAECRRHRRLGFTAARALGPFEGCLREAIHRLKYGGRRALAQPLGELLIEFLQTDPEARLGLRLGEVSFLVPVPLHPSRQRERGFNQAALLARVVGEWLNRPVLEGVLERIRDTRPQVELSGRERRQNVRGAFQAREHPYLPGATALLVDDVYTTGATVRESAFALKRQGVKRVMVLTLARVVDEYRRL